MRGLPTTKAPKISMTAMIDAPPRKPLNIQLSQSCQSPCWWGGSQDTALSVYDQSYDMDDPLQLWLLPWFAAIKHDDFSGNAGAKPFHCGGLCENSKVAEASPPESRCNFHRDPKSCFGRVGNIELEG